MDLAKSVLPILELCFDEKNLDFDLLLSSVLINYDQDAVLRHLDQIRPLVNDENRKRLVSFISLLFHHATRVGVDMMIMESLFGSDPHTQYLTRQDTWIEPDLISWVKQVLSHLQDFVSQR